ncbi:MAG TPA: glycogen synthase GlgA, partial [Usitatibacter sp.]|nr:glycogen synthase GlgA [Usitatibacter sp.]
LPPPHPQPSSLSVLFATPECAPLAKTGGLGDVSGALPAALAAIGIDVRVLLPGYPAVLRHAAHAGVLAELVVLGHRARLLESKLADRVPLLVLDCPELYQRGGGPYQADDGDDWEDNPMRFGVLSRVAALLGGDESPLDWRPDIVHCNDWPTALAPLYMRFDAARRAASVVTIHNLAFQGVYPWHAIEDLAIPEEARGLDGIEYHGRTSFLKAGIVYADAVTTVSPTYAREIQTPELGFGMDGILRMRGESLHGVLNGIDTAVWNPQADPHLASGYGMLTLPRKVANKRLLRKRLQLGGPDERPLLGTVSRITHQKGMDVLAAAIPHLVALGAQVAVVGSGDRDMIAQLKAVEARHRESVGVFIGFDEAFAHLVEAGADAFLMPSRFEPCGMNQMYSQRYGTPPIANATGGLVDTIVDDAQGPTCATGFLIPEATPEALVAGVTRALAAYRDPPHWKKLQLNGMTRDFGWEPAARAYLRIYEGIRPTS